MPNVEGAERCGTDEWKVKTIQERETLMVWPCEGGRRGQLGEICGESEGYWQEISLVNLRRQDGSAFSRTWSN